MMKRKGYKRGFTLVEILIGLAILSIITSAAFTGISAYRRYSINLSNEHCKSEIVLFINKCRSYSFYNNIEGYIMIDVGRNRLVFRNEKGIIYEYNLKGKKLMDANLSDKNIYIKSSGKINVSGTIFFRDERNEHHRLTIHVGTGYVDEKE